MDSIKIVLEKRRKIIHLIKNGVSIPQISKKLNIGKSTIYYHYRKIKGRKYPLTKIPVNQRALGEFLGAFSGDGSFIHERKRGHYTIRFHLHRYDDAQYAQYLRKLIEHYFGKKPSTQYVQPNGLVLKLHSKRIYELISEFLIISPSKSLNVSLKKPIKELSEDFLSYFVRGVIDTDGSVDNYGRIVLGLITKDLIDQISMMLNKFQIEHKVSVRKSKWKDLHVISIRRMDASKYLEKIGFSNKRKGKKVRKPGLSRSYIIKLGSVG